MSETPLETVDFYASHAGLISSFSCTIVQPIRMFLTPNSVEGL